MSNVNTLLSKRLSKAESPSIKMAQMSKQSASGNLTGFSGIFSISELSENEKGFLEAILNEYSLGNNANVTEDLNALISITSEVKAINNQAAILHGERIKKAHDILIKYREGAFTTWLMGAYGNRQTPYNFLQYYEFYQIMPKPLRPQIEAMPRQAVYTLASREGSLDKKREIVENYKGETKSEILNRIRETFPLALDDKRRPSQGDTALNGLQRLCNQFSKPNIVITKKQKKSIQDLIEYLRELVDQTESL